MTNKEMKKDVIQSFYMTEEEGKIIDEVLIWEYDGDYDMTAFVLFRGTDGKLYEVHGSHCSCYALEGQFDPEETTAEALRFSIQNSKDYGKSYHINFRTPLKRLLREGVL